MAKKKISTICIYCDSEYKLEYSEDLVSKTESLACPFCGEEIEEVEENDKIDYEDDDNEFEWDSDE